MQRVQPYVRGVDLERTDRAHVEVWKIPDHLPVDPILNLAVFLPRRVRFDHQLHQSLRGTVYLLGEAAGLGVGLASGERCGLCALFPNRSGVLAVYREDAPGVRSRMPVRHAHAMLSANPGEPFLVTTSLA